MSFLLLTTGALLLVGMPVAKPACKRAVYVKNAAATKRPTPVHDMELPCGAVNPAVSLAVVECEPPEPTVIRNDYPLISARFPADPFPEGIYTPPRG